jgi:2,3-diketo-5-methylthio-1-phosphopentane phosphatase
MRAFCDFDGTISKQDVTDLVLERFALPEWHDIEEDWIAGKIQAAECMRRQVALIQASRQELDLFLDEVDIDPHFLAFNRFCHENQIRLTVVSDGVDYFIRRVLARHGMSDIEVIANRLVLEITGDRTDFSLAQPFANNNCNAGSGVCKCAIVAPAGPHFYVGDSRSDFCVSHDAMFVFAKYKLVDYCEANGIPYVAYADFSDVTRTVETLIREPAWPPVLLPASKSA